MRTTILGRGRVGKSEPRGVLDTCAFIDFDQLDPGTLPDVPDLTSVTMAELHQGIAASKSPADTAKRLERLNLAVERFAPLPFDGEAASRYGTLSTLVLMQGRTIKRRKLDLMIAAIASVHEIPLYTRNIDDFKGLESLVRVVAV